MRVYVELRPWLERVREGEGGLETYMVGEVDGRLNEK